MTRASTIADGYPGQEVRHQINGGLILNDRTQRPSYIKIEKLNNWHGLSEADNNREARIGRLGELLLPSERRGKTVVYELEARSKTLPDLRNIGSQLRGAVRARGDEFPVDLLDPTVPWRLYGRTLDLAGDDEQYNGPGTVWPWSRKYQWTLRMSDPRVYVWNGGAAYASNYDGASINVVNSGNTDTDPLFLVNPTPATAPSAPGLALQAAGPGLGIGTYRYKITYKRSNSETDLSAEATIVTTSGNQNVSLTLPIGPAGVIGRNIYRTSVNGAANTEKLLVALGDNVATNFVDTLPDSSLGAAAPAAHTTCNIVIRNLSIPTPYDLHGLSTVQLEMDGVPLGGGQVSFDFKNRIILQGGIDISPSLNIPLSNWWDENQLGILPGNNGLTCVGGSWGVSFYHASE